MHEPTECRTGAHAAPSLDADFISIMAGVPLGQGEAPSGDRPGVCGSAAVADRSHVGAIGRIYIAGPMSGMPGLNYDAFNSVAKQLRDLGYDVENPAENPTPACGSWEAYMRMAIAQLVTCEEIHMLRGWSLSRGAKIERELAGHLGLIVSGAPA